VSPGENPSYPQARDFLAKLPDLGAEYLNKFAEIEGLRNRVIAAAALAQNTIETETRTEESL